MLAGRQHPVKYMLGYCRDEGKMFNLHMQGIPKTVGDFEHGVREMYGDLAQRYLQLANVKAQEDLKTLYSTDDFSMFALSHQCFAELLSKQNNPGYLYLFDHDIPGGDGAGSYHGSDLWFVFDSLGRCWRPFIGKHYDLARRVSTYFVNFVKTGNPNGKDVDDWALPRWDVYRDEDPQCMVFGETIAMRKVDESELFKIRKKHYIGIS